MSRLTDLMRDISEPEHEVTFGIPITLWERIEAHQVRLHREDSTNPVSIQGNGEETAITLLALIERGLREAESDDAVESEWRA